MTKSDYIPILAVGLLAAIPILVVFIRNWKIPYYAMFMFVPFSGWVAYRVVGPPGGLLVKDFLFATPAYIGFVVELKKKIRFSGIPQAYSLVAMTFGALVVVQMFNPNVLHVGIGVGLVGARVWLFYMPFLFLTYVILSDPKAFVWINRIIALSAWIPCPIGLAQYFLGITIGHEKAMRMFWGEYASAVSQGFVQFSVGTGSGSISRIPATFTFVAQYGVFILGALIFTLLLVTTDSSRKWRSLGWCTVFLLTVSGLLSGTRSLIFMIPAIVVAFFLLQRGVKMVVPLFLTGVLFLPLFTLIAGFSLIDAFHTFAELIGNNLEGMSYYQLMEAVRDYPFGIGTGMNTNAARHMIAMTDTVYVPRGFENSYAKAILELGFVGGILFFSLMFIPWVLAVRCWFEFKGAETKAVATGCLIYITLALVYCSKGYFLDIEPSCIHYWIFVGMIFRLNAFRRSTIESNRNRRGQEAPNELVPIG